MATSSSLAGSPDDVTAELANQVDSLDGVSPTLKTFIKETLIPHCTNPVFVSSVTTQNSKGLTLQKIREIDTQWSEAEEELPIHTALTSNACAEEIRTIAADHAAIGETFVMDNQGANVGQNELTSDYWQGDEAKWKNSFNGGQGGVDVGDEKLDRSTNQVLQQVSLPIIDGNGAVIGAVTFGISTGRL